MKNAEQLTCASDGGGEAILSEADEEQAIVAFHQERRQDVGQERSPLPDALQRRVLREDEVGRERDAQRSPPRGFRVVGHECVVVWEAGIHHTQGSGMSELRFRVLGNINLLDCRCLKPLQIVNLGFSHCQQWKDYDTVVNRMSRLAHNHRTSSVF
jgi:hypothetical protein